MTKCKSYPAPSTVQEQMNVSRSTSDKCARMEINKLLLCDCYRLNVCAPPPTNSYVVILTPDVLVLVVRIGGC